MARQARNGSTDDYDILFKVVLLGDAGVGKTSLMHQYVDSSFVEDYASTIGVGFKIRSLRIQDQGVKMQIWDTAGQERYASLISAYFRGAHGVIIVYDVTNRATFEKVIAWAGKVQEHASDAALLIVGNKSDLDAPVVLPKEGDDLAASLGGLSVQTSAKSHETVEEAFDALASQMFKNRRSVFTYGPPPAMYGPPPPSARRRSCCHHLGPPGNAYHEGSRDDRGRVVERSRALAEIRAVNCAAFAGDVSRPLAAAVYDAVPLLLRGVAKDDGSFGRSLRPLQPAALQRRFGQRNVPVAQLKDGCSVPPFRTKDMKLGDFLGALASEPCKNMYLQQLPVMQHLPELKDLGLPVEGPDILRAIGLDSLVTCTLFCGPAGVTTSLHFDRGDWAKAGERADVHSSIDNLFVQLSGRKRFRLFRACDHERLYARGAGDSAPHVSRIEDIDACDAERFPLFQEAAARSFEVELGPGDALLLPRWWWHQTTALSQGHAAAEAKAIATEVDQADNELHQVKQEVTKLNVQIFEQQNKAKQMQLELKKEQQSYQQELKEKAVREQEMQNLTALLAGKDKAVSTLEGRFFKLQRKAKAARRLLEKEEKKAKLQELSAKQQLAAERERAEQHEREASEELQKAKAQLKEEAEKAKKAFDEQVKLVQKKHLKEVKEQEQKISQQVKIEKGQIMEKVKRLEKELSHEQEVAKQQAAVESKKEEQLRQELKRTKEAEDRKVAEYKQKMQDLESGLQKQREASSEKVSAAKTKLQQLQQEVISEEEALTSKKNELAHVEKEVQATEKKAQQAEAEKHEQEKHLQAKLKAASMMERRGMTSLQRQSEHQAAKLRKMIEDEKVMEREQVAALEQQIQQAEAEKAPKEKAQKMTGAAKVVKVHAKFLHSK
ncbi:unnamed protein product [Effrenium voratum]|uniref:JmjC domain-containing protein n=1 Tax=Effrenium voratum TaxID=2562239 RepID=A0AA36JMJ9_9DINO|nr:unnamed protein product [Effrenium voratum]